MTAMTLIESLSLVEMLIYGFIGVNMLLSGSFLVHRSVQKLGARAEG